ncbi:MAG: helix-turn-helix transcriptional regulator [Bacteroidetes bacterium]|nr:helix-turn-helix transcriptional regulator [Bacteroidota bacterium]
MTFGQRIMYCRKRKKISQAELGNQSNISKDIIGKYERDEIKPSIEKAKIIANVLEVTLDYLTGNSKLEKIDQNLIKRMEIITQMSEQSKNQLIHLIDIYIKDYKSKIS